MKPAPFDLRTNVLDKLNGKLFLKDIPLDNQKYIKIYGLLNSRKADWNVDT